MLRAVNRPNAGMLIDTLHFAPLGLEHRGPAHAAARVVPLRARVRRGRRRSRATTAALIRTARAERLFPGEGGIDVRGILAALPEDIPYSLEIPRTTLASLVGEKECARLALMAARLYLDDPDVSACR